MKSIVHILRIPGLVLLMFLYYVVVVVAQQPASQPATKTVDKPSTPTAPPAATLLVPSIPDAHRAEFFHRQLDLARAQSAFQSAVELLSRDCGEKFLPQVNQIGDPVCAPRVEMPVTKPAEPAPTKPTPPAPDKKGK
jgi:hypothetical protein